MNNFLYHNQIAHHKPCFNLFILHNNLFDNQGSKLNKNVYFCTFQHTYILPITNISITPPLYNPCPTNY